MEYLAAIVSFLKAIGEALDLIKKHDQDIADLKTRMDATDQKLETAK